MKFEVLPVTPDCPTDGTVRLPKLWGMISNDRGDEYWPQLAITLFELAPDVNLIFIGHNKCGAFRFECFGSVVMNPHGLGSKPEDAYSALLGDVTVTPPNVRWLVTNVAWACGKVFCNIRVLGVIKVG